MRTNKLTLVLVLCMLVPGMNSPAQEEEKPVAVETISLQKTGTEEPTILELQKAAIRYAEVNPDKITNWRRQAAARALMPEVSVGYNNDLDATISTATSNGKTNFWVGPDDTSTGWDFTAKWDLGDLVYNTAQTSIDSRSKLMVELRNDILEQLNAAYFERKKIQKQLSKIVDKESQPYIEREIKIEELAATIDGLTGGYLSSRMGAE